MLVGRQVRVRTYVPYPMDYPRIPDGHKQDFSVRYKTAVLKIRRYYTTYEVRTHLIPGCHTAKQSDSAHRPHKILFDLTVLTI